MSPLRTKEAITSQVPPLITAAKNSILGGASTSYNTLQKLYSYLIGNFYTRSSVNSLINSSKNSILGGVSTSYNTLQKLYSYVVSNFYTRSQSDSRYDKRADNIAGGRINSGIRANNITSGTLATNRIPSLSASKITSGTLPSSVTLPLDSVTSAQLTETGDPGGAAVGAPNLQNEAVTANKIKLPAYTLIDGDTLHRPESLPNRTYNLQMKKAAGGWEFVLKDV